MAKDYYDEIKDLVEDYIRLYRQAAYQTVYSPSLDPKEYVQ